MPHCGSMRCQQPHAASRISLSSVEDQRIREDLPTGDGDDTNRFMYNFSKIALIFKCHTMNSQMLWKESGRS